MKIKFLFMILFLNSVISAQELSGLKGAFGDVGFGARPVALGGAYVGLSDDIHSVIWNPAGLADLDETQVSFTFANHFGLINYHFLAFGLPIEKSIDGIGIGLIYAGDDALNELTFQAGYARKFENLLIGANLKLRYASFGNNSLNDNDFVIFEPDEIIEGRMNQVKGNAFGFGIDIGARYQLLEKVSIGLMLRDIYSPVFWNSENDNEVLKPKGSYSEVIPFEIITGASMQIFEDLLFNIDYLPSLHSEVSNKIRAGFEARLFSMLYLRAGTNQFLNNENDDKYVVGIGLDLGVMSDMNIKFDYTYLIEDIANTQRIFVGIAF